MCQTPFQIFNFYILFSSISDNTQVDLASDFTVYLIWIGRVAALLNSSINPLVYNMTNENYRKAFQIAFRCGKDETEKRIKTVNVLNHVNHATSARTSRM